MIVQRPEGDQLTVTRNVSGSANVTFPPVGARTISVRQPQSRGNGRDEGRFRDWLRGELAPLIVFQNTQRMPARRSQFLSDLESPLAASSNRCASTISIELAAGIHICQPLKSALLAVRPEIIPPCRWAGRSAHESARLLESYGCAFVPTPAVRKRDRSRSASATGRRHWARRRGEFEWPTITSP